MKTSIVITVEEGRILKFLEREFLDKVKSHEDNPKAFKTDRHYKWISTARIARGTEMPLYKVRKLLYGMKSSHVDLRKMSGICVWAPTEPPKGYKHHQFKDYFEKIK